MYTIQCRFNKFDTRTYTYLCPDEIEVKVNDLVVVKAPDSFKIIEVVGTDPQELNPKIKYKQILCRVPVELADL